MSEQVNHPNHYNTGKIEVIDFIEDQKLDFHLGNAVKYICRAGRKDKAKELEDLDKAVWYINRRIEQRKKELAKDLDLNSYDLINRMLQADKLAPEWRVWGSALKSPFNPVVKIPVDTVTLDDNSEKGKGGEDKDERIGM